MKKITRLFREKMLLIILFGLFAASTQAQTAAITGSTIGCIPDAKVLGVAVTGPLSAPYTYLWSNGATTSTISITNTGLFRVSVTGTGANGNSQTIQSPWRIFIFLQKPTVTISANGPTSFCSNGSVTLTAAGGNANSLYLWNTGETTSSITVSTSGNYNVTMTQTFFGITLCSNVSNTIVVTVLDGGFSPSVTANGPLTFCIPGSVTLTAQSGFASYLWTNGSTTQATTVTLNGTIGPVLDTISISCTVSDSLGCVFTTKTIVARAIRQPELESPYCPNYNLSLGDSIMGGIVLKYLGQSPEYEFEFEETTNPGTTWVVNNGTVRRLALANVTPALQVGKFYLVRERAVINGIAYCYGDPCIIGISSPLAPPSGNNQKSSITGNVEIGVFPNPSNDLFNVNILSSSSEVSIVKVMDLTGRIIENLEVNAGERTVTVGQNLNAGMYLIQVSQGSAKSSTTRIVKTN